ncbi:AAA family ATPase [Desulfobacterales bacterium HSG2]|nr:AAA family ATPase [Desulfobacterales bacterium HSG2]
MIVSSLKVQNYKLLKDLEIEKMGQINLIVGKNNSGKSTVLECLRILASGGNPSVINEIVQEHDEQIMMQTGNKFEIEDDSVSVYEGLFTDRKFSEDGKPIYIGTLSRDIYVEIDRVFYEDTEEEKKDEKGNIVLTRNRKIYEITEIDNSGEFAQLIRIRSHQNPDRPILIQYPDNPHLRRRTESIKPTPISYVPTQFLSMDILAALWDRAVLTSYFDNVRKFLKIISENFEDIAFVKVSNPRRSVPYYSNVVDIERTGIVKLDNFDRPIPLNGMGDGVLRILQLVLGIFPATNGFLLIDEFENGLHFSAQEQIWKLIFELASELNIQVFATTHSRDCVEAFSVAANLSDEEAVLFRIGKSVLPKDKGKTIATVFDKNSLQNLTQSTVELR